MTCTPPVTTRIALTLSTAALALVGCAQVPAEAPTVSADAAMMALPSDAEIIAVANRAADWQLANMTNIEDWVRNISPQTDKRRGWVQGAFYIGLADYAMATDRSDYINALRQIANEEGWRLGDRLYHADDHLVGQVYDKIAPSNSRTQAMAPTLVSLDRILANRPTGTMMHPDKQGDPQCSDRWCWADALFMAPATWWEMAAYANRPDYADFAHEEFVATTELLFDEEDALYFRDSRFFDRRDADGEKMFWSRGNGWVYGGIVNVLRAMPVDDPRRAYYVDIYRRMSDRLVELQTDEGLWRASLLATSATPPETSGSSFFTYGLAWGVNEGLLKGDRYRRAVAHGWQALSANVTPEGRLQYVQQIGDRPTDVLQSDSQFYGVGAFLLAAGQMLKLK